MKFLGFALLAMAAAIAASPRAIADSVTGSNAAANQDHARLSSTSVELNRGGFARVPGSDDAYPQIPGQVTWSGYVYPDPGVMELSEVVGEPASAGEIPVHAELAKPTVNEVSTITGSGLTKSTPKPAIRAMSRSAIGSRQLAFQNSATPEPSSLVLLGTGLLGLAFVVFRKAKSSPVVVEK